MSQTQSGEIKRLLNSIYSLKSAETKTRPCSDDEDEDNDDKTILWEEKLWST